MQRVWSYLAHLTVPYVRMPMMYQVSTYCAYRAGFFNH